jgi:hypothetical protein
MRDIWMQPKNVMKRWYFSYIKVFGYHGTKVYTIKGGSISQCLQDAKGPLSLKFEQGQLGLRQDVVVLGASRQQAIYAHHVLDVVGPE